MDKEELQIRMAELEHQNFLIQMNDHLSASDYAKLRDIDGEYNRLKRELETY